MTLPLPVPRLRLLPGALLLAGLAGCATSGKEVVIPPPTGNELIVTSDEAGNISRTGSVASNKSIPVLVNDVPITSYDISQRTKLIKLGGGKGGTKAATEELIDETLQLLEAQRRGVNIPNSRVDFAFNSIAERLKMSPTQFSKALGSQGVATDSLKKRIKAQMTWQQLVQQRTQQKAQVSSQDITAELLKKGDPQSITLTEYVLQQIIFVVPSGSKASAFSQRRREASAFRQRFSGCDNSLEQAKQLRGVVVKDIGRRDSAQLAGPQGDIVNKTAVGKTSEPIQTEQGIELIAVCSKRDIQSTDAARLEVTNNLYFQQAEGLGKDYMKELRDRAIIEYR